MKTIKNWMLVALVTGLGACSNEENVIQDVKNPITVEVGFGLSSRVTTDGLTSVFEAKDAIGVYAWTGGISLPDASNGFQVYNVTNTYDGTNWSATPQMLWMDDTTPHYFLGVYPQTDILTTATYTLDPTDQVKSDLLVALNYGTENKGIAQQSNPVPLAFGHVMAKLRVNIKFNDEFTTQPAIEGVTAEAKKTATIDWGTATATATGTASGVQLQQQSVAESGFAYSYESVMVPQTGLRNVAMVIDGETYTFVSSEDIALTRGTVTTLNLTAGRTSAEVGSITINEWVTDGAVVGSLENISMKIKELEQLFDQIQSVTFIPQYTDGKVKLDYTTHTTSLDFMINPNRLNGTLAEAWKDNNEVIRAYVRYTNDPTTRAVAAPIELTVSTVTASDGGMINITVKDNDPSLLSENFWDGRLEAVIYIVITNGKTEIASEAVPMIAHSYAGNTNAIDGFGDGGSQNGEASE